MWGYNKLAGQTRIKRRIQLIRRIARLAKDKQILELGCGTGTFTTFLAQSGARITALDLSPTCLNIARKNCTSGSVTFMEGNAEQLTDYFTKDSFDAIVGNSILHHLDIQSALPSIYSVLKPNGIIVFSEPNMMNPQILIQKNIQWVKTYAGDSPDETAFFRWEITRLLEKAHFRNIHVVPFDFLHPKTPDPLVNVVSCLSLVLEKIPSVREFAGSLIISARK